MPLETGKSKSVIGRNIATEINAGKPKAQAAAIAYRTAGIDAMLDSVAMLDASTRFKSKSDARIELNRATRVIDKYWTKDQAGTLTKAERAEWQEAFKSKQAAQQYLTSTQEPVFDAAVRSMCDSVGKLKSACDDRRVIGGVGNSMTAAEISARGDGASIQKNFRFITSRELDLGKLGFGEIEFAVAVKVSIEASVDRVVSHDWTIGENFETGKRVSTVPQAAMVSLERWLSSSDGKSQVVEAIGEKL